MTIYQKFKAMLVDSGMFAKEAEAVMQAAMNYETLKETMAHRWQDRTEDYPQLLFTVLWVTVRRVALEWIEKNQPLAWYKPLFEEEAKDLGVGHPKSVGEEA